MATRNDIYRHTSAVIHLDHLAHNFHSLRKFHGEQNFFCPMVKANGYGHGDVEVSRCLEREGAKQLGVGLVEEGLLLRQMGVKCELLVFGIFDRRAAAEILRWRLTPVISVWSQIEALESLPLTGSERIPVHVKFDTGMHRLGFSIEDSKKVFERLLKHPKIEVKGICTHFFKGEDAHDLNGQSIQQLQKFSNIEQLFSPMQVISHTLNSAGIVNLHRLKEEKATLPQGIRSEQGARPGLLIYGLSAMDETPAELSLKPVMSLRSHIVRYHRLHKGETVSYGATWAAPQDSIVGVIPIGYADGYHRWLSNKASVLIKGQRAQLVGTVCMDYIMVDVTGIVSEQDVSSNREVEATLFGYDSSGNLLKASELAAKAHTIPWEILTSVGERVPRVFVGANL
jgi:alanine racemase